MSHVASLSKHPTAAQSNVVGLEVVVVCGALCRQQLWRRLLDTMAGEAMWLRNLLGLPEGETWIDKTEESPISDAGETHTLSLRHRRLKVPNSCSSML